jgi:DNA-binding protein WhiA
MNITKKIKEELAEPRSADSSTPEAEHFRRMFLERGSLTVADGESGYMLSLAFTDEGACDAAAGALAQFGFKKKLLRGRFFAYVKKTEGICDFLAYLGASSAVLEINNMIAEGELRNSLNRATNCEMGNMGKRIAANANHLEAINKIEKNGGLGILPKPLKDAAEMRKKHPEDSLLQIAERLKITKSGANHRFRKIIESAKKIIL